MTFLVQRLADLRRYLDHLDTLSPRVASSDTLRADLSLHNDVLFSLLSICQLVIDIAGELSARHRLPYDDYTTAVRNLAQLDAFPEPLVERLARLPGFRNVLIHDYVGLNLDRVVEAMAELGPVREFAGIAAQFERQP